MLKKIIAIGLLVTVIPYAQALEQLTAAKKDIAKAKQQVNQTIRQLNETYSKSKNGMLSQIEAGKNSVNRDKKMIDDAARISKDARVVLIGVSAIPGFQPITVPILAITGDVPEVLGSLSTTLNSIVSTLNMIDATVRPKIELLNPGTEAARKQAASAFQQAIGTGGGKNIGQKPVMNQNLQPKGLFEQAAVAVKAFDDVEKKIDEIMDIFKQASEAI